MEIPKNKDDRIGDLPIELRNMLKNYRVTPEIVVEPDPYNPEETPWYNISIIYADGSVNHISLGYNEEVTEKFLINLKDDNFTRVELGEREYDSDIFRVYLDEEYKINQLRGCCMSISLSKEAFSILIVKLRLMFSDYLKCKEDPDKYKMNDKY